MFVFVDKKQRNIELSPSEKNHINAIVWVCNIFNVTFVVCYRAQFQINNLFISVSNMYKLNCIVVSSVNSVCRLLAASLNTQGSSL